MGVGCEYTIVKGGGCRNTMVKGIGCGNTMVKGMSPYFGTPYEYNRKWVSETQKYIEGEIFYFSIDNFCFSVYNVIMMRALLP